MWKLKPGAVAHWENTTVDSEDPDGTSLSLAIDGGPGSVISRATRYDHILQNSKVSGIVDVRSLGRGGTKSRADRFDLFLCHAWSFDTFGLLYILFQSWRRALNDEGL